MEEKKKDEITLQITLEDKGSYQKYNSIELPKERDLIYKLTNVFKDYPDDELVYFREKIHGCNFAMILNVKDRLLQLGKRSEPVTKWFSFDLDFKDFEKQITGSFFRAHVLFVMKENW